MADFGTEPSPIFVRKTFTAGIAMMRVIAPATAVTIAAAATSHSRTDESTGRPAASMICGRTSANPRNAGMPTWTMVRSTRCALNQISGTVSVVMCLANVGSFYGVAGRGRVRAHLPGMMSVTISRSAGSNTGSGRSAGHWSTMAVRMFPIALSRFSVDSS